MPGIASTYRVFLACPNDLHDVRKDFFRVLRERNQRRADESGAVFLPIRWESTAPGRGRPYDRIRPLIEKSDFMVVVFKDRIGEPIDVRGKSVSGTCAEFELACELRKMADKPMKDVGVLFLPAQREKALEKFRDRLMSGRKHLIRDVDEEHTLRWHLENMMSDWEKQHTEVCLAAVRKKPLPTGRRSRWGYLAALAVALLLIAGHAVVTQLLPEWAELSAGLAIFASFFVLLRLMPRPPQMESPTKEPMRSFLEPHVQWYQRISVVALVMATALFMSLLSMAATTFFPPESPTGPPSPSIEGASGVGGRTLAPAPPEETAVGEKERATSLVTGCVRTPRTCFAIKEDRTVHAVFIFLAVVLTSWVFSLMACRRSPATSHLEISIRIGFFGIFLSGLMGVAVSLPYTWGTLSQVHSPVATLSMAHYILILRLGALPLIGLVSSYLFLAVCSPRSKRARASMETPA